MIESVFLHEFKENGSVVFGEWVLWRKSMNLWNKDTDEIIHFESLEEAYQFELKGKTIKQRIDEADISLFEIVISGGSGRGSPTRGFKVYQGGVAGGGNGLPEIDLDDLPARVNVRVKTKNEATAIREFRNMFNESDREHVILIDRDGFVNKFRHGGSGSVSVPRTKREDLIVHNHPAGGPVHFSGADLIGMAEIRKSRGIVATHAKGYYKIEKGTHFKEESFSRAVKKLVVRGKDYDTAMDRWMKRNQKKFGYKYTNYND